MNAKSSVRSCFHLVPVAILAQLLLDASVAPVFAAELKKPSPSPSDALFDPSRVIQIEIRLDPKDWHALRISHRRMEFEGEERKWTKGYEYVRADVMIDGQEVKSVGVRKKGWWGSTASTRPSLKINFDKYVKGQEFGGLEMMTLNNLIQDPTRAQQFLAYSFMEKAGVPTPRSNLARVVVNGEDLGIYGHVECIDQRFIQRHFKDAKGDLYESEFGDFTTNLDAASITHQWGKDHDRQHVQKLAEVLQTPDAVSLKSIEELVDLDAFVTFWVAEVLMGMNDSYSATQNNFFVYRESTSGKFHFIPWGRDAAFRDPRKEPFLKSMRAAGILCQRLWEIPEVRERYRREMRRLLADVWNENAMIEELDRLMRLSQTPGQAATKRREVEYEQIVRFVNGRRNEIQPELDRPLPDIPKAPKTEPQPPPPPRPSGPPMEVRGSFSATLVEALPTHPTNYFGHGTAAMEFTVEGQTQRSFARFGALAAPNQGRQEFTQIEVVAADAAGKTYWQLSFMLDPHLTVAGKVEMAPFALWTQLNRGELDNPGADRWSPARHRSVYAPGNQRLWGTLELDQSTRKIGGTISGKFKINTTSFEEEKQP